MQRQKKTKKLSPLDQWEILKKNISDQHAACENVIHAYCQIKETRTIETENAIDDLMKTLDSLENIENELDQLAQKIKSKKLQTR